RFAAEVAADRIAADDPN
ncbi:hypothetical protein L195_g039706, partial [Trifolium pratense]